MAETRSENAVVMGGAFSGGEVRNKEGRSTNLEKAGERDAFPARMTPVPILI
jgi:hypothetical protein